MSQNYISDVLFHFVGKNLESEKEQYVLLKKIVHEGWISFPPHVCAVSPGSVEIHSMRFNRLEDMINPDCVCFADIPIKEISLHTKKYSKFGLGFSRGFLLAKGANPIFYIGDNSTTFVQLKENTYSCVNMKEYYQEYFSKTIFYFITQYLQNAQKNAIETKDNAEFQDTRNIFLFLINVFSHFQAWNDKLDETDPNNFYYEREWRALNNINFALSDIKEICLPKKFIELFKKDFPEYQGGINEIDGS
ncbi:MAG: abortive infection system antitoxin AbiGi family protein [Methanoregula sp.]|jgi:hypothetical protein